MRRRCNGISINAPLPAIISSGLGSVRIMRGPQGGGSEVNGVYNDAPAVLRLSAEKLNGAANTLKNDHSIREI